MKSKINHILTLGGLLILGAIFVAGCANNNPALGQQNNRNANGKGLGQMGFNGERNSSSSFDNFLQNSTTGTISDLVVGKRVIVSGTGNTDGSLNAVRIMIGELPGRNFNGAAPSANPTANRPQPTTGGQQGNFRQGENGNFQGRTGGIQGGSGSGSGTTRRNGNGMVAGEIIKIDNTSMVLNTMTNGSKLVFYSSSTPVYILELPTSTPDNNLPPTGTPPTPAPALAQ